MAVGSMDFAYGDAYPNITGITETGFLATPDKEAQEVLAESETDADKTDITQPRKYTILVAIGLIVALVVFLVQGANNMEKYLNIPSILIGLIGGFLGGFDKLTHAVILFMIVDYLSATLIALYNKELSSEIGFKGIIKKIFILLTIVVAVEANKIIPDVPLREMILSFYIANEGISILENICKINAVPQALKQVFLQLRGDNET